jgi:hypothetical protein
VIAKGVRDRIEIVCDCRRGTIAEKVRSQKKKRNHVLRAMIAKGESTTIAEEKTVIV